LAIYVRRSDGTLAIFTVTAVRTYARSRFPTGHGLRPARRRTGLVTYGGTFDYADGSYLSNVIMHAELSG
jgi:hypothetical protein